MKKIGTLKGKSIIEGNPNEIKNNQIYYKESEGNINLSERKNGILETISNNSSSGGVSSKYANSYYKFVDNTPDEMLEIAMYASTIKFSYNNHIYI